MFEPIRILYSTLFRFLGNKRNKFKFVCSQLGLLLSEGLHVLMPIAFGMALNVLQENPEMFFSEAKIFILWIAITPVIFWIINYPARITERTLSFEVTRNFKLYLFKKLNLLPLKWHKNNHSGDLLSRVQKSSTALQTFSDSSFLYLDTLMGLIIATITIFVFNWKLASVLLVIGVLSIMIINRYDKIIIPLKLKTNDLSHVADSNFYDYITNIATVITLHLSQRAQRHVKKSINKSFTPYKKQIIQNENKWFFFTNLFSYSIYTLFFVYIFLSLRSGEGILIGSIFILYQYLQTIDFKMMDIGWQYNNLLHFSTDLKSADIILKSDTSEYENDLNCLNQDFKQLEIKDLSFRYEDEKKLKHNLNKINFKCSKGEKIAFIGSSGSGKTTFLKILKSLELPDKGTLNINGEKVDSFNTLCGISTLIPQEPEIFENTIVYNLTFGINYSKEQINNAIKNAKFDEVLKKLPNGLKTSLKEKGVNLSGGQKQRLAVARGLLAAIDCDILLLDEPTASLDTENEVKIYKNIFRENKDKTVISVLHKLNLLDLFDTIYLFENGEILTSGTLAEVSKNPRFQTLLKNYKKVK